MAVIPRKAGSASARPRSDDGTVTILGRQPFLATSADALAPTPLDAGDQFRLDALMAHTRRSWADRLAGQEAELAPEAAEGFAARMDAAFDAERERTLADLPLRLRAHAQPGLGAIGAEIVNAARVYEGMAARVAQFNTAKRATDDHVALVAHDRTAYDRLRDEGLAMLATAPLSDGARALLGERLVAELAHSFAVSHIDDDPAEAHAALMTAGQGEEPSPYDVLTDEQRQRYAARALTEGARRRATAQFTERQHLEATINAGGGSKAEIEANGLTDADKREVHGLLDRRVAEEKATAAALARFNEPGAWDPANPADKADAERVLVALGGEREALARGEPAAHEALLRVAQRTGIVPDSARKIAKPTVGLIDREAGPDAAPGRPDALREGADDRGVSGQEHGQAAAEAHDLERVVADAMERSGDDGFSVTSTVRGLVRRLGRPALEVEIAILEWAAENVREYEGPLSALTAVFDIVAAIPWFGIGLLGGVNEVVEYDLDDHARQHSANSFAGYLLEEFERGVKRTDATRLSIEEIGDRLEARAFELLEDKIEDGTIHPDEAAIYVPAVSAAVLLGIAQKRLHAGSVDPRRDVEEFSGAIQRVANAARLAQIRSLIPEYVREMHMASDYRLGRDQLKALGVALRREDFGMPLEHQAYTDHNERWRGHYSVRQGVRNEWTARTGQPWPKCVINGASHNCPAHHIIPQKNNGPHEWWNVVPVHPDGHRQIVHGAGSSLRRIQRSETDRHGSER
jgi:hypothetical protein